MKLRAQSMGMRYVSSGDTHLIPGQSQNPSLLSNIKHIRICWFYSHWCRRGHSQQPQNITLRTSLWWYCYLDSSRVVGGGTMCPGTPRSPLDYLRFSGKSSTKLPQRRKISTVSVPSCPSSGQESVCPSTWTALREGSGILWQIKCRPTLIQAESQGALQLRIAQAFPKTGKGRALYSFAASFLLHSLQASGYGAVGKAE